MLPQHTSNETSSASVASTAVAEQVGAPDFPVPAPATKPLPPPEGAPVPDGLPYESPPQIGLPPHAPPRQMAPPPYGPPPRKELLPSRQGAWYGPPTPLPRRRGVPWYAWLIGALLAGVLVLSLLVALAMGLFIGFIRVATGPQVSSSSTSTFTVTDIPRIVVKNNAGDVTVVSGPNNQVTIEVTRHARDASQNEAQNDLNRFNIALTQNGNTVNAIATGDWQTTPVQQRSADLLITVPSATNLDLTLQAGNITVNNVAGGLTATVNAGNLTTRNVTLKAASLLNVIAGEATIDARLSNGTPLDVSVTTGTAQMTLPTATAAHLDARVTVGNISVTGWPISVARQGPGASANGDLNANPKSILTIRVTTGSIQLTAG